MKKTNEKALKCKPLACVCIRTCTMHTLSAIMSCLVDAYTTCNGKYAEEQMTEAQRVAPL